MLEISESSTLMKSKNSTYFWQLPRRLLEAKFEKNLEISGKGKITVQPDLMIFESNKFFVTFSTTFQLRSVKVLYL